MADRIIRDPNFAKRLELACEQSPHCPPLHQGRLRWLADQFKLKFDEIITTESVRKWTYGESRPKHDKNNKLAAILGVDATWLFMGVDPELSPRERKARNALADGAVNVVAGLIAMDGGHPAFPAEDDKRALKDHIDLQAIIKGASYSFHVTTGDADGRFVVPPGTDSVVVLGLLRDGMNFRVVEIPQEVVEAGNRRGGSIEVVLTADQLDEFAVQDFSRRL